MTQPEKHIENSILEFLALHNIFAFKVKSQGTFDQAKGQFRRPSRYYKKGVADILGIFNGKFLAIEVKSAKGRLSPVQKLFLEQVHANGGMAFVARSIDDVATELAIRC